MCRLTRAVSFFFISSLFFASLHQLDLVNHWNARIQKLMHNSRFPNHQQRRRERNENHRHFVSVSNGTQFISHTYSRLYQTHSMLYRIKHTKSKVYCMFWNLPINKYLMTDLLAFLSIFVSLSLSISNKLLKFRHYVYLDSMNPNIIV